MNNPIVIAIISAGLSAFVTCTFQMINKFIDMKKEKRDKEEEKERIYSEKKEQVYIAVLDRLLQVRRSQSRRDNRSKTGRESPDGRSSPRRNLKP